MTIPAIDHASVRAPQVVEVFADIVCPFTHVGLRRLIEVRRELGREDVGLRVRAWPLELVNGEPLPRSLLSEEIEELRASVAPDEFGGFDPQLFPLSSVPALAMVERAYAHSVRLGEVLSMALRDALFERGVNISDHRALSEIGGGLGVDLPDEADEAAVLRDLAEGRERGVVGSPHFFVGDADYFCPTLNIRRVDDHMAIEFDAAGFSNFLNRCFGEASPPSHR